MFRLVLVAWLLAGCRGTPPGSPERPGAMDPELAEVRRPVEVGPTSSFEQGPGGCGPLIEARVLSVSSDGGVVLDQGNEVGVRIGYLFRIQRNSTLTGLVRIQDVRDSESTSVILHENEEARIATGDFATTDVKGVNHPSWDDVIIVCPHQPDIDGIVLDVAPKQGLLTLDAGRRVGVQPGYVFDVYRGSTYKGMVRVTLVEEDRCQARVLDSKRPIEPGDSATTNL